MLPREGAVGCLVQLGNRDAARDDCFQIGSTWCGRSHGQRWIRIRAPSIEVGMNSGRQPGALPGRLLRHLAISYRVALLEE